jgi:4-amino-4-deoxy-L-arabinose transferase-like glycosyltransferase
VPDNPISGNWRRDLLILVLGFGVLYGFCLGHAPLANPDEGRYAEIPREMVATGDWVTPQLDGVDYFEKPPLMYWAVAACLEAFGPSEGSLRLVLVLFGVGGVLLAYAAGRSLGGRREGLWSAVVLGTSLFYMAHTRILILDLGVAVLMSATLFCFILGVRTPPGAGRRWLFYGLYASAALATLTKGLIGFLVTGAVMFLWLLVFGQWRRLRPLYLPTGALLFLAIAAPWHILVGLRNPGWAHFYFIHEHWERFTTTEHGRTGPWWYFIPLVLFGLFPWVGFLWPSVRDAVRGGWARRKENADAWFLLTWAGFIFLFFSKSESKLPSYILPVFPPLAVLIGTWLARAAGPTKLQRSRAPDFAGASSGLWVGWRIHAVVSGLLAAGVLVAVLRPGLVHLDPSDAAALLPYAVAVAGVLAAGGVLSSALARRPRMALACMAAAMVPFFWILTLAEPRFEKPGTKALALEVRALAGQGDRVFHYHEFFHDFTFYAARTVDLVGYQGELEPQNDDPIRMRSRFIDDAEFRRLWAGEGRAWAVARKRDVKQLFADPTFHYHLIGEAPDHYLISNRP